MRKLALLLSAMMRRRLVAALCVAGFGAVPHAAQPQAPRPVNLTGTVVAVNQQSDSITLIHLKTYSPIQR